MLLMIKELTRLEKVNACCAALHQNAPSQDVFKCGTSETGSMPMVSTTTKVRLLEHVSSWMLYADSEEDDSWGSRSSRAAFIRRFHPRVPPDVVRPRLAQS